MRSDAARKEIGKLDKQTDALVDRIVDAGNDRVVKAYEARIAKMERDKLRLQESIENSHKPKHTFEDLFELALSLLSSPWKIWNSGDFALKLIVLRLVFGACRVFALRRRSNPKKRPIRSKP